MMDFPSKPLSTYTQNIPHVRMTQVYLQAHAWEINFSIVFSIRCSSQCWFTKISWAVFAATVVQINTTVQYVCSIYTKINSDDLNDPSVRVHVHTHAILRLHRRWDWHPSDWRTFTVAPQIKRNLLFPRTCLVASERTSGTFLLNVIRRTSYKLYFVEF